MKSIFTSPVIAPFQRMRGVFKRHFYLWSRNPEYFFETFWQPIVDVFIWGFISIYLERSGGQFNQVTTFFLSAVVLWAVLRRGQHEITFTFMEEAWSRNLQNILMTPVKMTEYLAASMIFGMVKLTVEISLMSLLILVLFDFNFFLMGLSIIPFAISLLFTGWTLGMIVNSAIIYFGRGLISLSWIIVFILQPFSCVFYPISILPLWAQPIAQLFPATWVFEGMRAVIKGEGFQGDLFLYSVGLNLLYLVLTYSLFTKVLQVARDKGLMARLET